MAIFKFLVIFIRKDNLDVTYSGIAFVLQCLQLLWVYSSKTRKETVTLKLCNFMLLLSHASELDISDMDMYFNIW